MWIAPDIDWTALEARVRLGAKMQTVATNSAGPTNRRALIVDNTPLAEWAFPTELRALFAKLPFYFGAFLQMEYGLRRRGDFTTSIETINMKEEGLP